MDLVGERHTSSHQISFERLVTVRGGAMHPHARVPEHVGELADVQSGRRVAEQDRAPVEEQAHRSQSKAGAAQPSSTFDRFRGPNETTCNTLSQL